MNIDTKYTEYDLRQAIHLVWRNLPGIPTTFNPCDCGRGSARGSGPCLVCAEEKLTAIVGPGKAHHYVGTVRMIRLLEDDMMKDLIE